MTPYDSLSTNSPSVQRPSILFRKLNLTPLLGQMAIILFISSAASVATNHMRAKPVTWFPDDMPRPIIKPTATLPGDGSGGPTTQVAAGELTADAVLKHLTEGTAAFVDAREPHEFEEGHLRGSIHLPSSAVHANIDRVMSLPQDRLVIIYCTGGECEASHAVQKAMAEYGFTNVVIYSRGWEEIISCGKFGENIETGAGQ
jgi:rhodanese-related sulfurtransferase